MLDISGQVFNPQLVIFDKDGTLIDFHLLWHTWFASLLTELGSAAPLTFELRRAIAETLGYTELEDRWQPEGPLTLAPISDIKLLLAGLLYRYIHITWNEAVALVTKSEASVRTNLPLAELVRPVGDARGLMQRMHAQSLLLAVATGDVREIAEKSLRAAGIYDQLDMLVCADDGIPVKPAPNAVIEICRRFNITPSQAIMIGDAVDDMTMAHAAGMMAAVGVTSGASPAIILAPYADALIHDIHAIHIIDERKTK